MSKEIDISKRNKKRDALFNKLRKTYDEEDVIKKLSDTLDVETFSTGSIIVDEATGVNGFPKGRIVELFGLPSSGKTTLALTAAREVQKEGGLVCVFDAENALNKEWASKLGVDVDELDILPTSCLEDIFDQLEVVVEADVYDLIIVDSVGAMVTRSELEGSMDDNTMALKARKLGQGLRKITEMAAKRKCAITFVNHVYETMNKYNPYVSSGGNALKFYSSMRISVMKIGNKNILASDISTVPDQLKDGEQKVGVPVRIKVEKNKVGPPSAVVETRIIFDKPLLLNGEYDDKVQIGFNKYEELFDACFERELIEQKTSRTYRIPAEYIGAEEDIEGYYANVISEVLNNEGYFEKLYETYRKSFEEEYMKKIKEKQNEQEEVDDEELDLFNKMVHYEVLLKKRKKFVIDPDLELGDETKLEEKEMIEYLFDESQSELLANLMTSIDEREKTGEYYTYGEEEDED